MVVWIVGASAIAVFAWLHEHDKRVRAEGRAEALETKIDSLKLVSDSAHMAVVIKDSTVALQKAVIAVQRKQMEESYAAQRRQTQAAVSTLRESLDSAQKVALDQITTGYEHQISAKDSILAYQTKLTVLANEQLAVRDSAYSKLQQASNVVFDAWQVEKKRASPGLVAKVVHAIPVVAGAVLLGHFAWP